MTPLVSIIIPVYNSSAFLQKSLESILQQTYPNLEIIVIDDESTDSSYSIAKQFESKGVKVLQQQNAGAAVARNTGLANATGFYIQFMDADDYLSPNKIEEQVKALEVNAGSVAVCNYIQFVNEEDLDNKKDISYQDQFIFSSDNPAEFLINLWGGNGLDGFVQTNCWLTPKSLVDEVQGWRNYRSVDDDGEFFARLLLKSRGIVHTKNCIVYYRHSKNEVHLSGNKNFHLLKNMLLTIDLKYAYLSNYINNPNCRIAFAKQYFYYAVYNYPENKTLSKIAEKRFRQLDIKVTTPMLGGKVFMMLDKLFGWKVARKIRYYLKEKTSTKK